jgi:hypothetical protein
MGSSRWPLFLMSIPSNLVVTPCTGGGATFAAKCGVLAFYIKLQGDWSSEVSGFLFFFDDLGRNLI